MSEIHDPHSFIFMDYSSCYQNLWFTCIIILISISGEKDGDMGVRAAPCFYFSKLAPPNSLYGTNIGTEQANLEGEMLVVEVAIMVRFKKGNALYRSVAVV